MRPAPVFMPREEALAEMRAALDMARARRDADYAAGRLTGERLAVFKRLLAARAEREASAAQQPPATG